MSALVSVVSLASGVVWLLANMAACDVLLALRGCGLASLDGGAEGTEFLGGGTVGVRPKSAMLIGFEAPRGTGPMFGDFVRTG